MVRFRDQENLIYGVSWWLALLGIAHGSGGESGRRSWGMWSRRCRQPTLACSPDGASSASESEAAASPHRGEHPAGREPSDPGRAGGPPLAERGGLPGRQVAQAAAEEDVVPELGRDDAGQAQVHDDPLGRDPRDTGPGRRARGATPSGSK